MLPYMTMGLRVVGKDSGMEVTMVRERMATNEGRTVRVVEPQYIIIVNDDDREIKHLIASGA